MADKRAGIAVKHDGLVAEILSERRVVLNKGLHDGISDGDKFVVFSLGEEVHDPKTGESLGILEEIKGKGEVIHVQDHMCTIQTYEFDMVPMRRTISPGQSMATLFYLEPEKKKDYREFVGVQCEDYARKIRS